MLPGAMLLRWIAIGVSTLIVAAACAWMVWLVPEDRALLLPKKAFSIQHSAFGQSQ